MTVHKNARKSEKVTGDDTESSTWSDGRLIRECLRDNEDAWRSLVHRYKNLVYSIPIKYGLSPDEAADIFQAVFLELISELPKLRHPKALPSWLATVASHKCFHWRRRERRYAAGRDNENEVSPWLADPSESQEGLLQQIEQEQLVRESLSELSDRCRRLIEMLFFESPALAYQKVAKALGIATGSVGFIRQRCLERLRRSLERKGLRP